MNDLPAGWAETTLGEMVRWGSGGTPRRGVARYYGGPIPWAIIGDLNDGAVLSTAGSITDEGLAESSARIVPPGTVLLAMYGSIGKLGIAGVAMATNQAIAFADPRQGLDSRFLFWYLRAERRNLGHAGKGATQKNISQTVLRGWQLPLPPLNEQRRIVAAIEEQFSRLDAADESLQHADIRLGVLRSAALAVAFDSTHPGQPLVAVTDQTRPICYGILKPKTTGDLVVPYVEVRSIRDGQIDIGSLHRTTQALHEEFRRSELAAGDVVLAIRGSFDRAAVVPESLAGANVSRDVARIAPLSSLDSRYLAHFLSSPVAIAFFASAARGVGVRGVNIGDLRRMPVPVPPLDEQRRIVAEVEQRLSVIDAMRAAIEQARRRSAALRRSILERAFRGELVPQDPTDEPASVLLERIRAQQADGAKPARPRSRI